MADEPVSRIDKPSVDNTELIDFIQRKFVNDVSFVSEVRFPATTLPQIFIAEFIQLRVFRLRRDEDRNIRVGRLPCVLLGDGTTSAGFPLHIGTTD